VVAQVHLPPEPGAHATFARDHEYKRYGTVSLLAGIDLLTGKVHAVVKDRHRSREFIEFLKLLDIAYPAHNRATAEVPAPSPRAFLAICVARFLWKPRRHKLEGETKEYENEP
jgi:hypothetical protein